MKKLSTIFFLLAISVALAGLAWGIDCATIQGRTITDSAGEIITPGYDQWGYNYEAHIFNGKYNDFTRGKPMPDPVEYDLIMKWNDAWLSKQDCDGNGFLDRHFGSLTYKGSGAWLTNHMTGKVEWPLGSGKYKTWTYFCKIVAPPEDAVLDGAVWKTSEGITIGPALWGQFAIIEEVANDPSQGAHGKLYKSPAGPGFGIYGKEGD